MTESGQVAAKSENASKLNGARRAYTNDEKPYSKPSEPSGLFPW